MTAADTLVCLFAKAPRAGHVKTRMRSMLSDADCNELHRDLIRHAVTTLSALPAERVEVELHITSEHPFFDQFPLARRLQRGADLGERMAAAVREGLERYRNVILVGADCPFITARTLQEVLAALGQVRVVMVPATDGGYVLLAVNQYHPRLFEDIAWGGASVAVATEQRLQQLGWPYRCLADSADIDRPEDLALLSPVPGLAHWALMSESRH